MIKLEITSASQNSAYGAIIGALVADAAGATLEFLGGPPTAVEIEHAMSMVGGGVLRTAPGQITDDGEMTVACMRAIAVAGRYDLETVARHYVDWARSKPFDIGWTTSFALRGRLRKREKSYDTPKSSKILH